jgi:hypothetical protein
MSTMSDTTTTTDQATALRAEAIRHQQEAIDSFNRCDTDGALSQWASGLTSRHKMAEADLLERGGVSEFLTLFDLDGNFVPAKIIQTQYGSRWMVLDAEGRKTGEFLPVTPKRRDTLAKRGYCEGYAMFPAAVGYAEGRGGLVTVSVRSFKTCKDHEPPTEVISADRFTNPARFSAGRK